MPSHSRAPPPREPYAAAAPSKASLLAWWKQFSTSSSSKKARPTPAPYQPPGRGLKSPTDGIGRVFGVSLEQSLVYASVAISMIGPDGKAYVYGYVPIVVAKCGMMLKETATRTEGIFRVSGSNKRINELQVVFDAPPRYGKDLDWEGYTVHDAASVLRRYLNMMPDPVIPSNLYMDFTAVLQKSQPLANSIEQYRQLISLLPPTSRYLLLYLLDFLSVFARSSSHNLMTASNLAVVFQPGLVSSRREGGADALLGFPGFTGGQVPSTVMSVGAAAKQGAGEHGRGKEVLEFLIEQQGSFVLGLEPPLPAPVGLPVVEVTPEDAGEEGMESGYGMPGGKGNFGVVDLSRRASEKSVERRRLRKGHDGDNAPVKRSRTLPGSSAVTPLTSDTIDQAEASTSVLAPRVSPVAPHRARKLRREVASTPPPPLLPLSTASSPIREPSTQPQSARSSSAPIADREVVQGDKSRDKGGWSPPWKSRRKSLDTRD